MLTIVCTAREARRSKGSFCFALLLVRVTFDFKKIDSKQQLGGRQSLDCNEKILIMKLKACQSILRWAQTMETENCATHKHTITIDWFGRAVKGREREFCPVVASSQQYEQNRSSRIDKSLIKFKQAAARSLDFLLDNTRFGSTWTDEGMEGGRRNCRGNGTRELYSLDWIFKKVSSNWNEPWSMVGLCRVRRRQPIKSPLPAHCASAADSARVRKL